MCISGSCKKTLILSVIMCVLVLSSGCAGIGIDPNTFKNSISLQVPITQAPNVYMNPNQIPPANSSVGANVTSQTPTPTKSRYVYV